MKYKLTKNTKKVNGITLYQIQALKDFGDIKKGDLGEIQRDKKGSTYINYFDRDDWPEDLGKLHGLDSNNKQLLKPDPSNPFDV